MPSVNYSYIISTTCSGGVNIDALSYEIRASEITKNLHYIYVDNDSDNVIVWFRETLTSSDEDILMYLLQNHKGLPVGMTTTSGFYTDYTKNLIINNEGDGIGVSPVMPFHVTTVTTSAPHEINGDSHYGVLDDNQIPSSIARYDTLASGYLNDLYYTEDELDTKFTHLSAGTSTANFTYNGAGSITVSGCHASFFTRADMHSIIETLDVPGNTFNLTLNAVNYITARYNNGNPVMEKILNVDLIDEALVIPLLTITTNNGDIHVLNWRDLNTGLSNRLHARFVRTDRFKRENGFTMYVNNKHLVCSSGVAWYGAMRNIIPAFDSHSELMDMFYTVSGVWTTLPTNLLENNYYGTEDGLVEAGDDTYVNCWIYRYISNVTSTKAAFILGSDDFPSLRRAEIEFLPSVPPFLTRHAILLGRITFVKGAASSTTIGNVFATRIPGNASDTHNALNDLQPVGAGNYYHLDSYDFSNLTGDNPVFSSVSGTHYGSGFNLTGIDHGTLSGLADDDHPQYLNVARGDARYYTETEVNVISGAINAKIITDHGNLTGLSDDDHPQYHNDARGDARYYTQTQLNNGQLNTLYYTETEINSLLLSLSGSMLTDHGALTGLGDDDHTQYLTTARADQRYYTEAEVDTISGSLFTLINNNYSTLQGVDTNLNIKINTTSGTLQYAIDNKDHGTLLGLADDDHTQYFNQTRGDLRYSQLGHIHDDRYYTETELNNGQLNNLYYTESEVNTISGAIVAKIVTDHGALTGLADDDHPQYHNDARGDTRYYTKTQTDTISGALNTKITTLSGALQTNINGKSDLGHLHDDRYYTETELNNGQLNNLYYTEAEVNTISGNLQTNINSKLPLAGGTVTGNLVISGNLVVSGTQFVTATESVTISDNIIYLNAGETGAGVTKGTSGMQIDRGTLNDYLFIFDEVSDLFKVGVSGSLQAVATREDSPTNNYIAYWNDSAKRFDTTESMLYTDIASKTYVNTTSGILNTKIDTVSGVLNSKIITDHGNLTGLADDDHTQYLNNTRGDARYYTQTQLNNGQLDTRYYTETEVNTISGNITSQLHGRSHGMTSTSDHTAGNNKVFYSNSSGQVIELALGVSGTALMSTGAALAPVFTNPMSSHGNEYHTSTFITSTAVNYTNLNTNGSVGTGAAQVAVGNHLHTGVYEPVISPKNTAFNVNFGTIAGTATQGNDSRLSDARLALAHGNERHTETYITLSGVNYTNLSFNGSVGTGATQVAQGNHTHAQLHDRSHAMTSTSDHTSGNNKVFYSNSSGQMVELALSTSGTILMSTGAATAPIFGSLSSLLGSEYADMPAVQVTKTTTTAITTSYADIVWNNQDIENYTDVIEWVSGANITVKETGLYLITYSFPDNNTAGHTLSLRVRKNTATVLTGSSITYYDTGVQDNMNPTFIASLAANDTIQLQATSNPGATYAAGITFAIVRLRGVKGDAGPAGSGSTVGIQSNSSTVAGSPFGTLNFKNATISGSTTSGTVDITVSSTATPGSPVNSVQFNNAGSFAGDAGMIYSSASDKLTISGSAQTTRLVLGGEDSNNGAALYIQVDGDAQSEGMRTYFKRSEADISGWIVYHYDGNTPNIRLIDEDDDPPYIAFQTIYGGTYNSPQFDNRFGTRGPVAGATTGFQWIVNGTSISEMDSQFFMPPKGTTAQRPGTPVAGYTRFNTTFGGLESHDGTSWQPQVFGTYFNEASDETDSSTTSTSWGQKVRLTTASLPAGKYRIGWHYNIYGASTSVSPTGRVQINDTDTIHVYLYEPKDASSNEQDTVSGFYYYTVAAGGTTLNIDLDYASEIAGSSMTIRRARLEFWRVS
jgi:hypothetical protein